MTAAEKDQPTYKLPTNEIHIKDGRIRKVFNRKQAEALSDSIRQLGQLQPGICWQNDEGKIELIIGERRLRACALLNIPFLYILKEETTDPYTLRRIELEENLVRENLDWRDEVNAKEELHSLFQKIFGKTSPGQRGGHGYADTAEHLGESRSILHEDVQLSVWAREVPEVASAKTKTEAKKIVARLEKTLDRREQLDAAIGKGVTESKAIDIERPIHTLVDGSELDDLDKRLLEFDRRCILGKMEDKLLDFKDESVDVMFFDPPWGVDFTKNKKESSGVKDFQDDVNTFFTNLEDWLKLLYQKMAKDSHLYMFFGAGARPPNEEEHPLDEGYRFKDFVYDMMEKAGFEVHRLPIIWHKKGAHHVRTPLKWPGRSYEPIAFARKGTKDLVEQGRPDVITTPMPTPSIKDIHPSAKHPEVYRELIQRSASPGNTLLDPMAGSGMLGVAAESLRDKYALDWWHIELDQDYRNLQIFNLNRGYWDICGTRGSDSIINSASLLDDFTGLQPGTGGWMNFWKTHPEKQGEMLEYAKTLKEE
uniref:Putative methyltransferase n=1 Tax=viral metagenome TaxID=1070528 RepID=A0A6M3L3E7_9ZZZZ